MFLLQVNQATITGTIFLNICLTNSTKFCFNFQKQLKQKKEAIKWFKHCVNTYPRFVGLHGAGIIWTGLSPMLKCIESISLHLFFHYVGYIQHLSYIVRKRSQVSTQIFIPDSPTMLHVYVSKYFSKCCLILQCLVIWFGFLLKFCKYCIYTVVEKAPTKMLTFSRQVLTIQTDCKEYMFSSYILHSCFRHVKNAFPSSCWTI